MENTIKKGLISLAILLLISVLSIPLAAQEKLPIKLGLKVAPNMCWMNTNTSGYEYNGLNIGGTVGFVADIYFAERYAFSTGLNFDFYNGKLRYADSLDLPGGKVNGVMSRKYKMIYLEIPLMVKMKTKEFGNFSFFGQIGFGTGFRIAATGSDEFVDDKGTTTTDKKDIKSETTLIRESVIINIGTEYQIDDATRLVISIGYSNSLNNVLTGSNSKTGKNQKAWLNFAELSIGVLF
jgi:hypothetical protein